MLPHDWLTDGTTVMGVLNVTPDSFSDGGRFLDARQAIDRACQMVEDGAHIIDIGGESTRPGATPVPLEEERRRVLPVLRALRQAMPHVVLSVDTMKPELMREAADVGADLINDVNGFRAPGALETARDSGCALCLMHMQGDPQTMQQAPAYDSVVDEVEDWLRARVEACAAAGIDRSRILVDPGIGFGKRLAHNLSLLAHVDRFQAMAAGVLVGASRKSMFGQLLDLPVEERLAPGLAVAAVAAWQGAAIIRTHDVRETVQAVATAQALRSARLGR
ncbi:dihydropteroate synthase [Algiphilus sp.]|uniref:dihydropteroate synthase n=1 Tax=Algiphilus sp. TaxID=1872431 RepID=UPI003B52156D